MRCSLYFLSSNVLTLQIPESKSKTLYTVYTKCILHSFHCYCSFLLSAQIMLLFLHSSHIHYSQNKVLLFSFQGIFQAQPKTSIFSCQLFSELTYELKIKIDNRFLRYEDLQAFTFMPFCDSPSLSLALLQALNRNAFKREEKVK